MYAVVEVQLAATTCINHYSPSYLKFDPDT